MIKTKIISVQASAGSGKTYSLAKRYIYLLFKLDNDVEIKNIVAITFTNKAAFEMKNRVINYLKKAALSIYTDDFFDDFELSKIEITRKSLKILEIIFKLYDDFNISTIDSFKNHILKSCAFNINLSPNFTIEKDYSSDLMFSIESFFKNINNYKNKKKKILKYLLQYVTNISGWIPKIDIYTEIKKIFNKSSNIGKDIFISKKNNYNYELLSRIKIILKKIKFFSKKINDFQIHCSYKKAIKKILDEDKKIFLSMELPNIFSESKLRYNNNTQIDTKLNIMWNNIYKEIKDLYKYYMKHYYDIYSNIYFEIFLEFNKQSKKKGIIYLNEINQKIVSIFNKSTNIIPEIYYRLSEQYKHFLIDEFQDTSLVQWIGIKRFLEESLANNGTFFYVGDIKQAIYAFRGGDYNIFNIVQNEFKIFDLKKKKLEYNFRSGQFIVDFNNNVFSIENIKGFLFKFYKNKRDFKYILNKFVKVYDFSKQKTMFFMQKHGYVETKIIDSTDNTNKGIEIKIIEYVIDALKRFDLKDIAILCRTNEEVFNVSSLLLSNKIKVESSQTLNIKNNDIIKQIMSFIKFINNFNDNISFSSFIIGDIFYNVSKEKRNSFEKFIFDFNNKHNKISLYNFFKIKYEKLCNKYFNCFFVEAGFISVYELIVLFLEKFLVIDNFYKSKIFIMRFLDLVKEFEIKNSGIDNFIKYFDNLTDCEDSLNIKNSLGDGVNVMTIHKSKGLQFPVVIIPFAKPLLKNIDKLYFNVTKTKIKLFNISKNISNFLEEAKIIRDNERFINLLSEINILYVAMTRAEYELYCIIPKKIGNTKNMFSVLLGDNDISFGVKHIKKLKKTNDFKNIIVDNNYIGYKKLKKNYKYKNKLTFGVKKSIVYGNIIHYALSKIVSLKNVNLNDEINNAIEFSKKKFFFANFNLINSRLRKMFKYKNILKLFMYDKDKIYNEKEIVDRFGNSFIVDKLIFDKNKIIIVDFKSSNYNMIKDIKQVKNYVNIMLNINLFYKFKIIAYIVNTKKCTCNLIL
ncbi:MAG: UvrD-helicase domain-containing protein [Endomicrobium sp.]|jgi:ATP-dependent exoDNAse (exonuclease V) beta subunit|nr:UvrD-helicase domain-containing protein [Endomicrobium sp.]